MAITVQEMLDRGSNSNLIDVVPRLMDENDDGFGKVLNGLVPRFYTRTGLTSSATHIEDNPGAILAVRTENGATERTIIHAGAAGAGQVLVTYAATTGIPTLVFGDGANTGYQVLKLELPIGMLATLASTAA